LYFLSVFSGWRLFEKKKFSVVADYNRRMPKAKRTTEIAPRIRETILKIPRGKVSSYGAIARAAGVTNGARQVVRVLGQSQGLPWHRVVAAGGRIAIPGEGGMDQRFRLEMEGVKFSGRKIRMAEFEFKFARRKSQPAKKKSSLRKSSLRKKSKR
jgi:methylated-DNA-protein-cysteine methyltransferase-like protein